MHTLAVIGASRGTGLATVQRALAEGLRVRAFLRPSSRLDLQDRLLSVHCGNCIDASWLGQELAGCATVAVTLGLSPTRKPVTLFSDTVHALLAVQAHQPFRLLLVTGIGAGDSKGHGGFLYDRIINPLLLGTIYQDKDRAEALLRGTDGDWLIVRPGFLTNGPETGRYRVLTDPQGVRCGKIARADVAHLLVSETVTPKRRHLAVLQTY